MRCSENPEQAPQSLLLGKEWGQEERRNEQEAITCSSVFTGTSGHTAWLCPLNLPQVPSTQLQLCTCSSATAIGKVRVKAIPAPHRMHAQRMQWVWYARGFLLQVLQVGLQNTVRGCAGLQVRLNLCQLLGGRGGETLLVTLRS